MSGRKSFLVKETKAPSSDVANARIVPAGTAKTSKNASKLFACACVYKKWRGFAMRPMGFPGVRSVVLGALAIACAGVLAGCDDHLTVDHDPSVKVQTGMTWAWRPMPQGTHETQNGVGRKVISRDVIGQGGAPPPQRKFPAHADPQKDMEHMRTRIAIEQTLAAKGLKQVTDPEGADFLVDYQVGVENKKERVAVPYNPPVLVCGYYGCWQSWGYWAPAGYAVRTEHYSEGSIVFDLVRGEDEKLAYRAVYAKKLDSKGLDQQQVTSGVQKMLEQLKPAKPKK
jgi:Domain of unknown function (DUF4136)